MSEVIFATNAYQINRSITPAQSDISPRYDRILNIVLVVFLETQASHYHFNLDNN